MASAGTMKNTLLKIAVGPSRASLDTLIQQTQTNEDPKQLLLTRPRSAYTVMRTHQQTHVFELDMHLTRLHDSIRSIQFDSHPPSLDMLRQNTKLVEDTLLALLNRYLRQYYNQSYQGECKIAVLIYPDPTQDHVWMECHLSPLSIMDVSKPVSVELHLAHRSSATTKDSQWVHERQQIEMWTGEANEMILMDAEGSLYEGGSSNFFAVTKAGTIETAPLDSVLPGTMQKLVLDLVPQLARSKDFEGVKVDFKCPTVQRLKQGDYKACFLTSTSRPVVVIEKVIVNQQRDTIILEDVKSGTWKHGVVGQLQQLVADHLLEHSRQVIIDQGA